MNFEPSLGTFKWIVTIIMVPTNVFMLLRLISNWPVWYNNSKASNKYTICLSENYEYEHRGLEVNLKKRNLGIFKVICRRVHWRQEMNGIWSIIQKWKYAYEIIDFFFQIIRNDCALKNETENKKIM